MSVAMPNQLEGGRKSIVIVQFDSICCCCCCCINTLPTFLPFGDWSIGRQSQRHFVPPPSVIHKPKQSPLFVNYDARSFDYWMKNGVISLIVVCPFAFNPNRNNRTDGVLCAERRYRTHRTEGFWVIQI